MYISTIDPVAFTAGPLQIRWYGLLFSGGFILGYVIMMLLFRRQKFPAGDLDRLLCYLFLGTVIGARLAHCLIYEPDYYLSDPIEILKIWKGGLASHGGTLGVIISVCLFNRRHKYRTLELLDMLCLPVLLVCVLIRIGNFCNSEIIGLPTGSDYGVVFTRLHEDFPRHPAQLYEAACYLILFVMMLIVYLKAGRRLACGVITGLTIALIFASRIGVEFFKTEQADYSTGTVFTVGQYLSLPYVAAGLLLAVFAMYRGQKPGSPTAV